MEDDLSTSEPMFHLSQAIAGASDIVFFTGAGMSTESGIADFRSPGGIWSRIKPIQYADFLNNEADRLEDWRRRFHFQGEFDATEPNAGHHAVASILAQDNGLGLITQNIDGLHQRAGVRDESIVEIHGNGTSAACLECGSPMTLEQARLAIEETGISPRCGRCGGLVKSRIISFGQPMPQQKLADAERLALACDVFIVLGSSLVVQPAATLPVIAVNNGARLFIVNREPTPLDALAERIVRGSIGETLVQVLTMTP